MKASALQEPNSELFLLIIKFWFCYRLVNTKHIFLCIILYMVS